MFTGQNSGRGGATVKDDRVYLAIVWVVVEQELPKLGEQLGGILKEMGHEEA